MAETLEQLADQALEGTQSPAAAPQNFQRMERAAETMGKLQKVRYTHQAMIDLILTHPELSQNQLAAHFGYSAAWVSNVMASDAFQEAMASRRNEIVDPMLKATITERTKALYIQSLMVLQAKLESPTVSDKVALAAAELGAKAMGLGGHAPAAPQINSGERLVALANNLVVLQSQVKGTVYENQVSQDDPAA